MTKLADASPINSFFGFRTERRRKNEKSPLFIDSTYYASPIYRGDVVILCKKTLWWTTPSHAMIITQYDNTNQDFKLAGHTSDRQAYPLLTAIANYAQVRFLCL